MKIEIQDKTNDTFATMMWNTPYRVLHDDLEDFVYIKVQGERSCVPLLLEFSARDDDKLPAIESFSYMNESYPSAYLVEVGFRTTIEINWTDNEKPNNEKPELKE